MPDRFVPNRAKDYRRRAEEARAKAAEATEEKARAEFLSIADTWERMAAWEDKQHTLGPAKSGGQE